MVTSGFNSSLITQGRVPLVVIQVDVVFAEHGILDLPCPAHLILDSVLEPADREEASVDDIGIEDDIGESFEQARLNLKEM
jgi:hypothetical protein